MDYKIPSSLEVVAKTVEAIKAKKGFEVMTVENESEALEKIKTLIPKGASVMNGASVTLEQIGFVDYLKDGDHGWKNLHAEVLTEQDPAKQKIKRRQATVSDVHLSSVHAVTEEGDLIIASNTASQLPSVTFNAQNLIFVIGTQKIVPTLDEGMKRLEQYVVPLENEHMQQKYGVNTQLSKIIIFKKESPMSDRKITVIFVNKVLGF